MIYDLVKEDSELAVIIEKLLADAQLKALLKRLENLKPESLDRIIRVIDVIEGDQV